LVNSFPYLQKESFPFISWCLLFFMIPAWSGGVPVCIVLLILSTLLSFKSMTIHKQNVFPLLIPVALYILYAIALLWTDNLAQGGIMMERKLSFLVFPLLFLVTPLFSANQKKTLIIFFVIGAFVKSALSFYQAIECYQEKHWLECFYSSFLSHELSPSYQALYDVMIVAFFIYFLVVEYQRLTKGMITVYVFSILYFSVYMIFLASKGGIISLFIVFLLGFLYFSHRRKKLVYALSGFMLILLIGGSFFYFSPIANIRFKNAFYAYTLSEKELFDKYRESTESTPVRLMIWKVSREEIRKHPFGTGTGDGMDVLKEAYIQKGMTGAAESNLNCHSQFLQTSLTLGYPGIAIFLTMLLAPLLYALKRDNYLLVVFITIIVINVAVESMFESQGGIVFFSVFCGFLMMNFGRKNNQIAKNR
jgi:O-antigen ligase